MSETLTTLEDLNSSIVAGAGSLAVEGGIDFTALEDYANTTLPSQDEENFPPVATAKAAFNSKS